MLEFFHEWTPEDRVITKLSSITLSEFLTDYLSKWNDKIIKYLNSIGNQIISPNDITIQQLASYYSHTGGKGNLGKKKTEEHRANIGKKRTEEHRANISAGNLGKKRTEEHRANISAGNLGKKSAGNLGKKLTEEHPAGNLSKKRVKSNDDKWLANLSKVMTFIANEGRTPNQKSSDAGERKLACWIAISKKNNERELLMRRDIPSVFINAKRGPQKRK
jgi:hypothetical protein